MRTRMEWYRDIYEMFKPTHLTYSTRSLRLLDVQDKKVYLSLGQKYGQEY